MRLYSFQNEIIEEMRSLMRQGEREILCVSETGSGKTVMIGNIEKTSALKGHRSIFCVHRKELIRQTIETFQKFYIYPGVIAPGWKTNFRNPIQIASIQALSRRLDQWREFDPKMVVFDEAHHCAAKTWEKVYHAFPKAFKIGLTASPIRLDGKGLGRHFKKMVRGPSMRWLIENGFLSDYKIFAPPSVDVSKLRVRMGDYVKSDMEQLCNQSSVTGNAIKEYKKHAEGKKTMVFCVSIKHSLAVRDQFRQAGFTAEHVDGESPPIFREQAMKNFKNGKVQVLTSVDIFGEGVDVPALECIIQCRPTKSISLCRQQWGRVLRKYPGKDKAIILDMASNCERHGLPCDEIEWELSDKKRKDRAPGVRVCKQCFAASPPGKKSCDYCGFVWPEQPREVDFIDGELSEIDLAKIRRQKRKEEMECQTYEDFVSLGKQRNYRYPHGWARHRMRARGRK